MSLKSCEINSHLFLCLPTRSPPTHLCNFCLPGLWSFSTLLFGNSVSLHASWSHCSSLSDLLLAVAPHIRSVSLTPDKEPQLPLCLPHFPHCQQMLHLCSYFCLSCSLGLPGADRHHRELRAFPGSWHFTAPQQLHTYQAAPILHCGEKTICHGVRIKDFTVKYQTSEGKRVTQICR